MHILLIGGTVFMGPHVVHYLHEQGHKVTVFHRGNTEPEFPAGVNRIYGDRNELSQHAETFQRIKPDVVIDMVCFTETQAQQLADTLGRIAGRIVLASSIDVYAAYGGLIGIESPEPTDQPISEDSPLRSKRHPYRGEKPRSDDDPRNWLDDYDKIPCEQIVLSMPDCEGAVVRLPMVFGPYDIQLRLLPLLKRMDDGRPAIIIDNQTARLKLTRGYSENMAWALSLAALHENATGNVYNAALADPMTEYEWIRQLGAQTGWNGTIVTPEPDQLAESLKPGHNPAYNLFADTAKIRSKLGFIEQVPLSDALNQTINWQRNNIPDPLPDSLFDYQAEDKTLESLQ